MKLFCKLKIIVNLHSSKTSCWSLLLLILFPSICWAEDDLRVRILSKYHPQTLLLRSDQEQRVINLAENETLDLRHLDGFELELPGQSIIRRYSGGLWVERDELELIVVNWVNLEDYVSDVVLGELGLGPAAAMQAQAVIARSYALSKRRPSNAYDLSDLAYHQVYPGKTRYSQISRERIAGSSYQVLTWDGKVIQAVYHAECGSRIFSAYEVWGKGRKPFLINQELDKRLQGEKWNKRLSYQTMTDIFGINSGPFYVRYKNAVMGVSMGKQWLPIDEFRLQINRKLGWNTLPSNDFRIEIVSGGLVFVGYGRGHMVGLCQQQARQLAASGWGYKELLQFFYPGTSLIEQ